MSYTKIEDLEVYILSERFSDEIWNIVISWDFFAKDTIGKQICRAADSIAANIAEGYGRFHYKENKNFCYYSRGSILETKSFLRKMNNRKLVDEKTFNRLLQTLETIHLKLNSYIKYIGKSSSSTK